MLLTLQYECPKIVVLFLGFTVQGLEVRVRGLEFRAGLMPRRTLAEQGFLSFLRTIYVEDEAMTTITKRIFCFV